MAAIGSVASVIAVLQLTSAVTGICYDYIIAVKDASKDLKAVINEVRNLESILLRFEDLDPAADEAHSVSLLSLAKAPDGPLDRCFVELKSLADILRSSLGSHAVGNSGVRAAGRTMMWPLKQKAISRSLEIIRREKDTLVLALAGDTNAMVRAARLGIESMQATQKSEHRRTLVQWLMLTDPSPYHAAARQKHEPTTGSWFLAGDVFKKWKNGESKFVWIHGIPGCGKSILCSSIVEASTTHCTGLPNCAMAYFYFDFNDPEKGQLTRFLSSLTAQLCSKAGDIPNATQNLYDQASQQGLRPSMDDLLGALREIIDLYTQTFLIIDALDECTNRTELLDVLLTISGWGGTCVSIVATSRRERDIDLVLKDIISDDVSIQTNDVRADIRKFVSSRISANGKLRAWPEAAKKDIETSLVDGADGMFRWVVCQLDSLQSCVTPAALRKALRTLPKTLPETYDRILVNIDEEHREIALKVLQWLSYSVQPLTLSEVAEAIAIRVGIFSIDPDDRLMDPRDILTVCSSLVTIAPDERCGERIRLAHYSVKEYLISEHISAGSASFFCLSGDSAHRTIAESCLTYIISLEGLIGTKAKDGLYDRNPLINYAWSHWYYHARMALARQSDGLVLTLSLLYYDRLWSGQFWPEDPPWCLPRAPLYHASLAGLTDVVKVLLERGSDVNSRGGFCDFPLIASAGNGNAKVVKLLLEYGAIIEAQNENALRASDGNLSREVDPADIMKNCLGWGPKEKQHGSALQAAVAFGCTEVVTILLDAGADPDAIDTYDYSTALHRAAGNGDEKMVRLLLDHRADPNIEGRFGTSLTIAARTHHTNTVKLLIESGADVNSFGGPDGYPLIAAVYYSSKANTHLLLDNGANINAVGGEYGSALCAAILSDGKITDILEITKLLLDRGANPNADIAGYRGRPLYLASKRSFFGVMRLLIEAGTDINTHGGNWSTALHATAWDFGNRGAMLLLLDSGADPNIVTERVETALEAAIAIGDEESVDLLLSRGADLSLTIRNCRRATPLQIAVRCCGFSLPSLQTVALNAESELRRLLRTSKSSDDMAAKGDNEIDNALVGVAISGARKTKAMEILLEEVPSLASENNKDRLERALIEAARAGSPAVVRLLLDKGVNPDATDKHSERDRGDTALQIALNYNLGGSSPEHSVVAMELLGRGAKVGDVGAGEKRVWIDLTRWAKGHP